MVFFDRKYGKINSTGRINVRSCADCSRAAGLSRLRWVVIGPVSQRVKRETNHESHPKARTRECTTFIRRVSPGPCFQTSFVSHPPSPTRRPTAAFLLNNKRPNTHGSPVNRCSTFEARWTFASYFVSRFSPRRASRSKCLANQRGNRMHPSSRPRPNRLIILRQNISMPFLQRNFGS